MKYEGCKCAKCRLKRKPSLSELTIQAEHIQRDYVFLSLGKLCEMCGSMATCIDHVFSRMVRELFFSASNLLRICDGCHYSKTNQYHGMHLKVYDYIKKREGIKKFEEMWALDKNRKPWPKWNREYVQGKLDYYRKKISQHKPL